MKNYRNNFKKSRFRNNQDRIYKKNNSNNKFANNLVDPVDFKRNKIIRGNGNVVRLIEKYTELAKEALSNGDKILSENYYQHADHFIRLSEKKEPDNQNKKINSVDNSPSSQTDENETSNIQLKQN